MSQKDNIQVKTTVKASLSKVWDYWTDAEHIKKWNAASSDWHTTKVENDLKVDGSFLYRMEAKDGSFGFDFSGAYKKVKTHEQLMYVLDDQREVTVDFSEDGEEVSVIETFEPETMNPVDMQKQGWQAILDNFKSYVEKN